MSQQDKDRDAQAKSACLSGRELEQAAFQQKVPLAQDRIEHLATCAACRERVWAMQGS